MSKQVWRGSTLLTPEPAVLVSCGSLEKPNLITVGWCGTICTQPSMVSISIRPERYSHHLIKESGEFVINLTTEKLVRATDWCGVKSGRDYNKFKEMNLTPAPSHALQTPIIAESPLSIECKVKEIVHLGSHDMFIAEVVNVQADAQFLDEQGKWHLDQSKPLVYLHGAYYALGNFIGRFGFSVKKKD